MRLAITGGAGYVGSHVVWAALDAGHEVVVIDDLSLASGELVPPGTQLIRCSVADGAALDEVFSEGAFDAVLHFAGSSRVAESVATPDLYFHNNVLGSITLFDAARRARVSRLVFSSSAAVYGHATESPISEAATVAPRNPYGESKAMVETMLRRYCECGWMSSVSLRYFNAAGADPKGRSGENHDPETHLIPNALRAAYGSGGPLSVFGDDYPTRDGTCVRDYVHVSDLASAHLLALDWLDQTDGFHVFNLGTGCGYSVREVIAAVGEAVGETVPHRIEARRPGDPAILVANSELARAELGWSAPHSDIRTIVDTAASWHRSQTLRCGGVGIA